MSAWKLAMVALACWVGTAFAGEDLLSSYRSALSNDADYGAAIATNEAGREEEAKGRAGLLPTISISGIRTNNDTTQTSQTVFGARSQDYEYTAKNYSLNLRQPLFRLYNWAAYRQGQAKARYSDAVFVGARQDLAVRLASAYFDVLLAHDNVELAHAQKAAITEQLSQARKLFKGGEGTLTDVDEAQARFDMAAAQELEALNNLEIARRALERILGKESGKLSFLLPEKLELKNPMPADMEQWVEWARQGNPEVLAQQYNLEAAAQEVAKARADHFPTVDLIASRTKSDSDTNTSINSRYDTHAVGVQLSIPLFAGGYPSANVRQGEANRRRAEQQLEAALRKATLDTRKEFLNVSNSVAQVKAYQQAVLSNENALYSTRKGFEVGLRTNVDILNAQQQLYTAKRDLAKSRYTYILSWLKLKAAVGSLAEEDIVHVNSWLTVSPP